MSTDVHEDGIAVVHCDPFTGIVLDPNPPFDKYNIKPNSGRIPFDSGDFAVQYCNSIVEQFPHLECHVIGLPDGDGYMLTDPSWIERESERSGFACITLLYRVQLVAKRYDSAIFVA